MKVFVRKVLLFIFLLALLSAMPAVLLDPYNVFHADYPRQNGVEANKNYIKMKHVLDNPQQYDSFIFGNSRVNGFDPGRFTDGRYYNLSYSEGLPAEFLENLNTLLAKGIVPKHVVIALDEVAFFTDPSLHTSELMRSSCPWTENAVNRAAWYLRYCDILSIYRSIPILLNHTSDDPAYAQKMLGDGADVDRREGVFREDLADANWESYYTPRWETLEDVRRIKKLCDENGIELTIFTQVIYESTYRVAVENGYLDFLKELAEITDYMNFSGLNDISTDSSYFFESMHYSSTVADRIVDALKGSPPDSRLEAQGFGAAVTKENADEILSKLRLP